MSQELKNKKYLFINSAIVSGLLVFVSFLWQGKKGFDLSDEGFLWYGVQRVLSGEVPIRDFMAYDPGRYYWCATLLQFTGERGIIGLRAAVAVFQFIGLSVGLYLVVDSKKRTIMDHIFWIVTAATLLLWMYPRHKLFDISLSIILIGILTYLIRKPSNRRTFLVGTCVGLVAVFGRNHGLYGALASMSVLAWLNINERFFSRISENLLFWGAGVVVGYLPVIIMALLIPGFAPAFVDSIVFLFQQKATNLSLPVPWPWTVTFSSGSSLDIGRNLLIGLFFLGVILFAVVIIILVVFRKFMGLQTHPALVASAFLSFPYAHYVFSRADVGHLAHGIFPLLIGSIVALSSARAVIKWSFSAALLIGSFWVMHILHPGWRCRVDKDCKTVKILDEDLRAGAEVANNIYLIQNMASRYLQKDRSFVAVPYWPGAYALLDQKAPMWEIYPLFKRTQAFELKEIERIKASNPSFAIILDLPLDGLEERRFRHTHPLTNQYIQENFTSVSTAQSNAADIYIAKGEQL